MKTPEEIKKGLECCIKDCNWENGCLYGAFDKCTTVMMEDALAYIRQLEAKIPKWVSVDEKLPENRQTVLFATRNNPAVYRGKYSCTGDKQTHYFTTRIGRANSGGVYAASHWMPLPEIPEKK